MNWSDLAVGGSALIQLFLVLTFLLKALPSWKEVRMAEISLKSGETKATEALAGALGQLGSSLTQMAETLKDVAIEQKRATEAVKILQRVNSDQSDEISRNIAVITDRIERLEKRYDEQQRPTAAEN